MGVPPMSDAELFADFLENREVIAALRPFWRQGITITMEHSPPHWSDAEPFFVSIVERAVEDPQANPHIVLRWAATGKGATLAEAAKKAVAESEAQQRRS